MDLEHTHLGSHCEVSGCNQRDFLPFTCDVCKKKLCLMHRTYQAHSCSGGHAKDMTSIDCPVCGKSVKFSKSESADEVWNQHYLTSCTQVAAAPKQEVKCYRSDCRVHLGPSNQYKCAKCNQMVCLSHRIPEEHGCMGMRGAMLANLPPAYRNRSNDASSSNQKKQNIGRAPAPGAPAPGAPAAGAKKLAAEAPAATPASKQPARSGAKGASQPSAAPVRTPASTSSTIDAFTCPFCAARFYDPVPLQKHVEERHPDFGGDSSAAVDLTQCPSPIPAASFTAAAQSVPASSSGSRGAGAQPQGDPLGREVCPLCQMRFLEATDLVMHFEDAHSDNRGNRDSGSSLGRKNSKENCVMG